MRTLIAVVVAGLVAGSAGTTTAQNAASEISRGAEVYGSTCGRCHQARSPLERTDREWVTIANHMRVRANLTGGQMRAVIAFLQATNNDPARAVSVTGREMPMPAEQEPQDLAGPVSTDAERIEEGRQLTSQNACLGCHVIGDAGGNIGPSLNNVVQRRGAAFVRQKMLNPTFDNATSMMPNFGLTNDQVEAIAAYLATFNGSE